MADFTVLRPFIYLSGTLIDVNQNNPNETTIYGGHNAAMDESTGHTHDGSVGNGAPTVLQAASPSVARQLGYAGGVMQYHDGAVVRSVFDMARLLPGIYNISFAQGADSSQLRITSSNGSALSASNVGHIVLRSANGNETVVFVVSADQTIDLTGAHWGMDGKGDVTSAILRVYAINDGNSSYHLGVGLQGGFNYCRNTQDDTTPTNINLPEEILTTGNVSADFSPMKDIGYIIADFTDASNEWAITGYRAGQSADGIWQVWNPVYGGFSANPTGTHRWTQFGKTVVVEVFGITAGTSNATTYTLTGPIKAAQTVDSAGACNVFNNSSTQETPGRVFSTASSVTLSARINWDTSGGGWAASNLKACGFIATYEAFQP